MFRVAMDHAVPRIVDVAGRHPDRSCAPNGIGGRAVDSISMVS
jgi:hypothetical protein